MIDTPAAVFNIIWKVLPPVLGVVVLFLLDKYMSLRSELAAERQKLRELESANAACANCAELQRLNERNNRLVLANLAANGKIFLHSIN